MQTVADRIGLIRREWGLTQEQFGRLAGVSKAAVSQWEKGVTTPGWDALHAIQRARGLNPYWVLHGMQPVTDNQDSLSRPPPATPPTLTDLLDALSARLAKADPTVRDAVAKLVLRYLDSPETGAKIVRAIEQLLDDNADPGA